jgi:DNA-binding response OmpR family regulator
MPLQGKEPPATKLTALIVDGNPQLQRVMIRHLIQMGYRVLSARHYHAAILHLASDEMNIACVDVHLPCKSGYQVCEYIRGVLGVLDLPILMTSDRATPTDMAHAEDVGANAFLCKPFSMRALSDCFRSLLHAFGETKPLTHELQLLMSIPRSIKRAAERSGEVCLSAA